MSSDFDPYYKWLSIPPQDQPPHLYRLLAVNLFEEDPDVIETAADQRMKHLRDFQTGKHADHSQRLLNEVTAAKLCLLNRQKKQAYDEALRAKISTAKPAQENAPRVEWPLTVEPLPVVKVFGDEKPTAAAGWREPTRSQGAGMAPMLIVSGALALFVVLLIGGGMIAWSMRHGDRGADDYVLPLPPDTERAPIPPPPDNVPSPEPPEPAPPGKGEEILRLLVESAALPSEFPIPTYEQRVLEAETDLQHGLGKLAGDGWLATQGLDKPGHLLFGPYLRDMPLGGLYVAKYRLMSSEAQAEHEVVNLDVNDAHRDRSIARAVVRYDNFHEPMQYQEFAIPFYCQPEHALEFRMWWTGNSNVQVDRVNVYVPNVTFSNPWNVQFFDTQGLPEIPSATDWEQALRQKPLATEKLRDLALVGGPGSSQYFATLATMKTQLPAGKYQVWTLADDGVRVIIDRHRVIDDWTPGAASLNTAVIELESGEHTLRVEHYQGIGDVALYCWMESKE